MRDTNDDWDDYDDLDDELADEDDDGTVPCPYCRRRVHEYAERCPHCEHYISEEDAPPGNKPWWLYLGVVVCLVIVFLWIWFGM